MDGLKKLLRKFLLYFIGVILFMAIASGEGLGFIGSIFSNKEETGSVLCLLVGIAIVCMFAWWFAKAAGRYFLQQYFPGLYRKRYGGSAQPQRKRRPNHHDWVDSMSSSVVNGLFGTNVGGSGGHSKADYNNNVTSKRMQLEKDIAFHEGRARETTGSEKTYHLNMVRKLRDQLNHTLYR